MGLSPFARLHRACEQRIEERGMSWTFLRPTGFIQTFVDRPGPAIQRDRRLSQPQGRAVSYIDTRDIARVAAIELTRPSPPDTVHDLTGPEALTGADLAALVGDVIGQPIELVEQTLEEAEAAMTAGGVPRG